MLRVFSLDGGVESNGRVQVRLRGANIRQAAQRLRCPVGLVGILLEQQFVIRGGLVQQFMPGFTFGFGVRSMVKLGGLLEQRLRGGSALFRGLLVRGATRQGQSQEQPNKCNDGLAISRAIG